MLTVASVAAIVVLHIFVSIYRNPGFVECRFVYRLETTAFRRLTVNWFVFT